MSKAAHIVADSTSSDFASTIKQTIKLYGQNPDENVPMIKTEPVSIEALTFNWEVDFTIVQDKKPNGNKYIQPYFKAPGNPNRSLMGTAIHLNDDFTPVIDDKTTLKTAQDVLGFMKSLNTQLLAKEQGHSQPTPQ